MESICKAGVSLLRVTINCLVFEGSAWCHILALGTYTILLKQKSLWWSFQIQEDKLKKVKFGNCIAAARNYRNCTRLSLMTSRWPSEVHADFIPPPPRDVRGDGGGGVYLKGVTFNVRVKCFTMTQTHFLQNILFLSRKWLKNRIYLTFKLNYITKTLITTHLCISLQFLKQK